MLLRPVLKRNRDRMEVLGSYKKVLDIDGITGIQRYLASDIELVELYLEAGAKLEKHALPFPVVFYVLEGAGKAFLSNEEIIGMNGDVIECPPNVMRSWENPNESELKILVIKKIGMV